MMLALLEIENIATIEKLTVSFYAGLNILTGETGAGKSILIDSINAVLGAKTSRELIRSGEEFAAVSAFFSELPKSVHDRLDEMGLPNEGDGTLNLRRKLYKDGKNACFVNGTAVTVTMLKSIAYELINIHGQRDAQALLQSEKHLDFLDDYAGNASLRDEYAACFNKCREIREALQKLQMDEAYKARRIDLLNYQIAELVNADLHEGETQALRHKKTLIQNAEKVRAAFNEALFALLGTEDAPGADSLLLEAIKSIGRVADVARGLDSVAASLEEARETVLDASSVLDDALMQVGDGISDLDQINERLDLIYRLSKKYGSDEGEMLRFLSEAQAELDAITMSEEKIEELNGVLQKETARLSALANDLSQTRAAAAKKLSAAVTNELTYLDMPNVQFVTDISSVDYNERGQDAAVFLLSANAGEEPKRLEKVASGGELSRVMLAIKNVLRNQGASTLIFDEIDAGVSGSAAGKIAMKLSSLAKEYQVLCVTHSAQIAAYANAHLQIFKSVQNGKTYTQIRELNMDERATELARITFGASPSETQMDSARQLILQARAKTK